MPENDASTDAKDTEVHIDFSEEAELAQAEQPTAPTESSTEEKTDAEEPSDTAASEDTESSDESESDAENEDTEESDESDETDEEPKQKGKNNAQNRIRSLANENRQLRQMVEKLNATAYQPKTAEQLVEEGMDENSAQIEAMRQEKVLDKFNEHVIQLNSDMNMESMQAVYDIPSIREGDENYDEVFHGDASNLYLKVAGLETDENTGQIINANVLPYDFYKSLDKIRNDAFRKGQIAGKKNARKTMNAAETPSQSVPKKEPTGPDAEILKVLLSD